MEIAKGNATKDIPWNPKTPPGTSEFAACRDEASTPRALVVQVGKTQLRYDLRCIDDLQTMSKSRGDWMPLRSADEKPAADGTVEAWGGPRRTRRDGGTGSRMAQGSIRDVRPSSPRGAQARRGRAPPHEQPDEGALDRRARTCAGGPMGLLTLTNALKGGGDCGQLDSPGPTDLYVMTTISS